MNEDAPCQIVPTIKTNVPTVVADWKTIMISVGLIMLFLTLSYFLYRFICHTNKRFRSIEQAVHSLNEREKTRQVMRQQQPPPPQFFMQQEPVFIQPAQPKPVEIVPPVVVDSKILDKELSEELKELAVEIPHEPEGRVDVVEEEQPNT